MAVSNGSIVTHGGGGGSGGVSTSMTAQWAPAPSHAVSRSAELVSCAKTAVKIAQSRHAKQVQQWQEQNGNSSSSMPSSEEWFTHLNPADLELYNPQSSSRRNNTVSQSQHSLSEDGLTLLRTMEAELNHLEGLVRRRGHSNDPTLEISASVKVLEQDASELTIIIQTIVPPSSRSGNFGVQSQKVRHFTAIQQWFQTVASRHAARLKEILAVRATVLTEQAQRRQRFVTTNNTVSASGSGGTSATNTSSAANTASTSAAANALFSLPPPVAPKPPPPPPVPKVAPSTFSTPGTLQSTTAGSLVPNPPAAAAVGTTATPSYGTATTAAASSYGGTTSIGYGGRVQSNAQTTPSMYSSYSESSSNYYSNSLPGTPSSSNGGGMGMRQRKTDTATASNTYGNNNSNSSSNSYNNDYNQQQQHLVQQYQEQRQTANRLKEAQQAEKSLAALGTVFGKMSTLLATQSETLQKVEDDVEAAQTDVLAGQEQITILYAIKKGNRPLIIKVYALLIFLIVFMRFYAKK